MLMPKAQSMPYDTAVSCYWTASLYWRSTLKD